MINILTPRNKRQCHVCGGVFINNDYNYWNMETLRDCYALTNNACMCEKCTIKANSFVNYFGKKRATDKQKLKSFILNGYEINKIYSGLMCAGYYNWSNNDTM
jgi:hypothetical protein